MLCAVLCTTVVPIHKHTHMSCSYIYTSVYYVLQSQNVATGYANNKIHKEAVKIDI